MFLLNWRRFLQRLLRTGSTRSTFRKTQPHFQPWADALEDRFAPATIPLPVPYGSAFFGGAVAMAGNDVLVGSIFANFNAGAAYLYNASGTLLQTFNDPGNNSSDDFGYAVAISGNDVLVGAPNSNNLAGAAYLFNSSGTLLQTFNDPGNSGGDLFGRAVAISGNDVLVGAYGAGVAYLYNTSGALLKTFNDPNNDFDAFGYSVAMSGNDALVGAYDSNNTEGAAYLYNTSGTLLKTFNDPGNSADDFFGGSVALSGNDVLVGADGTNGNAGAAYLYNTSGTLLQSYNDPSNTADDFFGGSVALSDNDALVSAQGMNGNEGAAYLYNTSGTLLQSFYDPSNTAADFFGDAMALSGNDVLVGAYDSNFGAGAAYLYTGEISAVFGNNQSTTVGTTFGTALEAQILDASGNLVQGAMVTFTETDGPTGAGAFFFGGSTETVVSNLDGIAVAPQLTANNVAGSFTVVATWNDNSDTFDLTNTSGTAASVTAIGGTPQNAVEGAPFGTSLQVLVTDSDGNPVADAEVTFTVPSSGASGMFDASATVPTNALGIATAPALTANDVAGNFNVSATVNGVATPATFALTNVSHAPASITPIGGTPQNTVEGSTFGTLLQALVTDSKGNPVADAPVTFSVPEFGPTGTFDASATVPTNALGIATAPALTANDIAGSFNVTASVSGAATPARFTLINVSSAPVSIPVPDLTLFGTASGGEFGGAVAMAGNETLVGAPGANGFQGAAYLYDTTGALLHTFTDPNNTANDQFGTSVALFGNDVLVGAFGVHNLAGAAYLFNTAGVLLQAFNDPNSTSGDQFGWAVALSGADVLVGADGVNSSAGAAYLYDTAGARLQTFNDPSGTAGDEFGISVALSANDVLVGADLANSLAGAAYLYNTAGAPLHTFNDPIGTIGDEFGISVALAGAEVLVGAPFVDVSAGGAYLYDTAGALLQTFNDPDNTSGDVFGISVALSGNDVLVGANTANNATGSAYLYDTAGALLQTFSDPNQTTFDDFGFAVALSGNDALVGAYGTNGGNGATYLYTGEIGGLAGNNQTTTVGTTFGAALEAQVRDSSGNVLGGASVTFTINDGPNGAGASFPGGSTATVASVQDGVASAPPLTANNIAGSFTVTADCGGSATTFALTNTSGAAAAITDVGGTAQNTVEGSTFGTLLQARVTDSDGNPVADVPVTFSAPSFGPTGTFNASSTVPTNALGIATAPAFLADHQTGSFVVTATVNGVATPADFDLTNTLVPARVSVLAGSAKKTTVATAYAMPLEVKVVNAAGLPVSGISVDFETPGSGASGAFTGGGVVTTNAAGIAIAPTLTANTTAGAFTVEAFVARVATPAKFTLTNTAGAPHAINVVAGNNQSATVAKPFAKTLQAEVVDQYGNPVNGVSVTFTIHANGSVGATFPAAKATATAITNVHGIATAPALTANHNAGTFTVTAGFTGVATPATFNLTNNPDPPYLAPKGTPESGVVGQAYAQVLQALITDEYGNPIAGLAVTFTAPATGPSGTFGGQRSVVGVTNANGVATAPAFTANTKAGRFIMTLTAHGAPAGTIALTNLPDVAADVKVIGSAIWTTTLAGILRNLEVEVTDQYGNAIANETVTFAVQSDPVGGADGTFAGQSTTTVLTSAAGIAIAPALKANTNRGTFTVTATVAGVAEPATFDMTIG